MKKSAIIRTIITYKYDKNLKIIAEKKINCDLDRLSEKVYFEPNSSKLSQNQNPPFTSVLLTKYKYQSNKVIAENYQDNQFKSKIVSETLNNKTLSFLIDTKGDTLRTTVIYKNSKGEIIKEQISGDTKISDYGGYGDGMSYDQTTYEYNSEGLIELITSENTETKTKLFTRFEYIKR
jgi:hypothetical protein